MSLTREEIKEGLRLYAESARLYSKGCAEPSEDGCPGCDALCEWLAWQDEVDYDALLALALRGLETEEREAEEQAVARLFGYIKAAEEGGGKR